ncbi:MAG: hypothetical protein LBP51_04185 [Deferribacteraceae bacterium]|jgi:outer membrane biogenesis lipoprotein LolB|nr:hypothetical protein [Deferribacteraceae bacterium]
MKKFIVLLLLIVVTFITACTVVVKTPAENSRSIERSNEAMRELDSNTK